MHPNQYITVLVNRKLFYNNIYVCKNKIMNIILQEDTVIPCYNNIILVFAIQYYLHVNIGADVLFVSRGKKTTYHLK